MEVSSHLHRFADQNVPFKQQAIIKAFAKALEIIPRQLCDNAGIDATDVLNRLRVEHRQNHHIWAGVDFSADDNSAIWSAGVNGHTDAGSGGYVTSSVSGVSSDLLAKHVWEPSLVKINALQAATEAACLILSVDETIKNEESQQPQGPQRGLPPGAAQRALRARGRGRGMPRR